jgi:hypothetical protein
MPKVKTREEIIQSLMEDLYRTYGIPLLRPDGDADSAYREPLSTRVYMGTVDPCVNAVKELARAIDKVEERIGELTPAQKRDRAVALGNLPAEELDNKAVDPTIEQATRPLRPLRKPRRAMFPPTRNETLS